MGPLDWLSKKLSEGANDVGHFIGGIGSGLEHLVGINTTPTPSAPSAPTPVSTGTGAVNIANLANLTSSSSPTPAPVAPQTTPQGPLTNLSPAPQNNLARINAALNNPLQAAQASLQGNKAPSAASAIGGSQQSLDQLMANKTGGPSLTDQAPQAVSNVVNGAASAIGGAVNNAAGFGADVVKQIPQATQQVYDQTFNPMAPINKAGRNIAAGIVLPAATGAGEVFNRDINAPVQATLQSAGQYLTGQPVTWGQNYTTHADELTNSLNAAMKGVQAHTGVKTGDIVEGAYNDPAGTALQTVLAGASPFLAGGGIAAKAAETAIGGYFGGQAIASVPSQIKAIQAMPDGPDKTQAIIEAAANTGMGVAGILGLIHGTKGLVSDFRDPLIDNQRGSINSPTPLPDEVSPDILSKVAKNSLANDNSSEKPGHVEYIKGAIDNGTAQPIDIRRMPDGAITIDNGRHTLEAARQLGLPNYPINDVTANYEQGRENNGRFALINNEQGSSNLFTGGSKDDNAPKPLGEQIGRLKAAIDKEPDPNVKFELASQLQELNDKFKAEKNAPKPIQIGKDLGVSTEQMKAADDRSNAEKAATVNSIQRNAKERNGSLEPTDEVTKATQAELDKRKGAPAPISLPKVELGMPKQAILNSDFVRGALSERAKPAIEAANALSKSDHALLDDLATTSPEELAKQAEHPKEFLKAATLAKQYNDYGHALGSGQGQDLAYREHYGARQQYDMGDKATADKLAEYQAELQRTPGYSKERLIPDYKKGEALGLKRLNKNFAEDIATDASKRGSHISELTLAKGLEEAFPDHVAVGELPRGYVQLRIPGGEAISVPKEIGDVLNARATGVEPSNIALKAYDKFNAGLKKTMLGGGGFHSLTTSLTTGGQQLADAARHPTTIPSKVADNLRLVASTISKKAHDESMAVYSSNTHSDGLPTTDRARLAGVTLRAKDIEADTYTGLSDRMKSSSLNFIKGMHDLVFDRQIPEAKLMIFEQKTKGLDTTKPADLAKMREVASGVNNLGGINRSIEGITPQAAQRISRYALATDFTETKFRKLASALTSSGEDGKLARQMVVGKVVLTALPGLIVAGAAGKLNSADDWVKEVVRQIVDPQIDTGIKNDKGISKSAKLPATEVSELTRIFAPLFNGDPNKLSGAEHYAVARGAAGLSTIVSLVTNKDYYGNEVVKRDNNGNINIARTLGTLAQSKAPIPIQQIAKTVEGTQSPAEAALNTVGFRVSSNSNDPQVQASNKFFDTQKSNNENLQKGNFKAIDPSLDIDPKYGPYWAQKYAALHPPTITDVNGVHIASPWSATSSDKDADYYFMNDPKTGKQVFSPLWYIDKKNVDNDPSRPHSPLFDLNGQGIGVTGQPTDKAQVAIDYQHMGAGDPQRAVMVDANPWLKDYEAKAAQYAQDYKPTMTKYLQSQGWNDAAIANYWDKRPQQDAPIAPPTIDTPTQDLMNQYSNITDPTEKAQFFAANAKVLSGAFDQTAQYVNQIRQASGNLALQGYPQESSHVQQVLDAMPQGTDKASKKARAELINANPDVNQYLADVTLHNVTKNLSEYNYVNPGHPNMNEGQLLNLGTPQAQSTLKGITSLSNYDIGKDANGNFNFMQGGAVNGQTGGGAGGKSSKKPMVAFPKRVKTRKAFIKHPPHLKRNNIKIKKVNKIFFTAPRISNDTNVFKGKQPLKISK